MLLHKNRGISLFDEGHKMFMRATYELEVEAKVVMVWSEHTARLKLCLVRRRRCCCFNPSHHGLDPRIEMLSCIRSAIITRGSTETSKRADWALGAAAHVMGVLMS